MREAQKTILFNFRKVYYLHLIYVALRARFVLNINYH